MGHCVSDGFIHIAEVSICTKSRDREKYMLFYYIEKQLAVFFLSNMMNRWRWYQLWYWLIRNIMKNRCKGYQSYGIWRNCIICLQIRLFKYTNVHSNGVILFCWSVKPTTAETYTFVPKNFFCVGRFSVNNHIFTPKPSLSSFVRADESSDNQLFHSELPTLHIDSNESIV